MTGQREADRLTPPSELDRARRRRYAVAMIRAADGPIPRYGDAAYNALDPSDRRRIASILVAAESWAEDGDRLAERLRAELAAARAADDDLDAEAAEHAAEHVRRLASVPTWAEVSQRRGEPDRAARSRARAEAVRRDADELRSAGVLR